MTKAINTHDLYNELVAVGLSEKQADLVVRKFATKDEVEAVGNESCKKLDLEFAINKLESNIEVSIAKLETSIIKWNLGFFLAIAGLFLAYLKYTS